MDMHISSNYISKIIILSLIALAIFMLPNALRWSYYDNPSIIGFPTHFHLRIAEEIVNGNFNWYDSMSFEGRPYTYPPLFVFLLASAGIFGPIKITTMILMALLGTITAFIVYRLVSEFCGKRDIFYLFIILTPGFVYLFSHLSSRSPPIMLGLAAIYLFKKKPLVSMLLLGFSSWLHPETALLFIVFTLIVRRVKLKLLIIPIAVMAIYLIPFFLLYGVPSFNSLHEEYRTMEYSLETPGIEAYIWEISEKGYFSIAMLALVATGIWKTEKRIVSWLLICILLSLMAERFIIYLIFPVIMTACIGYNCITERYGKKIILFLSIFLIIYMATVGLWRADSFAKSYPEPYEYRAMIWIRENTAENETIFSDWMWGHWISGIAERKNFLDGYAEYAPDAGKRIAVINAFYENCTVPESFHYVYMEQWMLDEMNTSCSLKELYRDGYAIVFANS